MLILSRASLCSRGSLPLRARSFATSGRSIFAIKKDHLRDSTKMILDYFGMKKAPSSWVAL
jgi:hypothetical protein